jgi:8-oxo-dGTP pyrophosphatase MutT (NUDIX family)
MTARRVAINRDSARVLLFDHAGRLLLMEGGNPTLPEAGRWWFPMGGGVEAGEDLRTAALRELHEEAGITDVELGPLVWLRTAEFPYGEDKQLRQREHYFVGRTATTEVYAAAWTEYEQRQNLVLRRWTVEELRETTEIIEPEQLPELIEAVRSGDYPAEPIELIPIHVGG